jgi:transcriptional regulator with XRE-family HTH domain
MLRLELFPIRLKAELRWQGISYRALAKGIGTSETLIYKIANGKHYPRLETAVQICNFLNISLDYLLSANDYEKLGALR